MDGRTDGQTDGQTDGPTVGPTKRGVESRSTRLKTLSFQQFPVLKLPLIPAFYESLLRFKNQLKTEKKKFTAC